VAGERGERRARHDNCILQLIGERQRGAPGPVSHPSSWRDRQISVPTIGMQNALHSCACKNAFDDSDACDPVSRRVAWP
jgi:hypothetical protein